MADFGAMSHADLYRLRENARPEEQSLIAPFEHQAFAREYSMEHPLLSLGLLGAIPAYQAAKAIGLMKGRSGTSDPLDQIFAGYTGMAQGLGAAARGGINSFAKGLRTGFGALFPSAGAAETTPRPIERPEFMGYSSIDRRGTPFWGAAPSLYEPSPIPFLPDLKQPGAQPPAQPVKPAVQGPGAQPKRPGVAPGDEKILPLTQPNRNPFNTGF